MCANNNSFKPFIAKKAHILIVDDSNVTLKIEKDLMECYGMEISTAVSGEECISSLSANRYDIIFMDHIMPKMDGIEATLRIRKMNGDYFKNVIIIALTANTSSNACSMYIKNGFNDFLEKPIQIHKLNKFLRTYLPREYIIETKSSNSPTKEFNELFIKDVNTKQAIQNCGGHLNNYLSLLSIAYHDGKNKLKIIRDFAINRDIKNYTIEVHSLKTVAALIGHIELSQLSKRHEIAGMSNDLIFILDNVDFLLNTYDNLLNNIKLVLPKEDIESKTKIKDFSISHLCDLAKITEDAIDNFDLDLANENLTNLLSYDLPLSQITTLNKVKKCIDIFDYDNAYKLITDFKFDLYELKLQHI